MSAEHSKQWADAVAASRRSAILADNERLLERVASIRMTTGPGPWPVADADGNVSWVSDSD